MPVHGCSVSKTFSSPPVSRILSSAFTERGKTQRDQEGRSSIWDAITPRLKRTRVSFALRATRTDGIFGLAPGGVSLPFRLPKRGALLPHLFTLANLSPRGGSVPPGIGKRLGGIFSCTSRGVTPAVTGALPYGVRTFCQTHPQNAPAIAWRLEKIFVLA